MGWPAGFKTVCMALKWAAGFILVLNIYIQLCLNIQIVCFCPLLFHPQSPATMSINEYKCSKKCSYGTLTKKCSTVNSLYASPNYCVLFVIRKRSCISSVILRELQCASLWPLWKEFYSGWLVSVRIYCVYGFCTTRIRKEMQDGAIYHG